MNKVLAYALKLLAKKDYTERELRRKFSQHQFEEEESENVLLFLREKNLIDDKRYAIQYARNHPSRGSIRIKYELIKRGICDETISEVVSAQSESEIGRAREMAVGWLAKKKGKIEDKHKLKQNIIAKLSRQGFDYGTICQSLQNLLD